MKMKKAVKEKKRRERIINISNEEKKINIEMKNEEAEMYCES
jgi:hypothetical protein